MKKKLYENPESELITVRFEGNFCATGNYGDNGKPGQNLDEDEYGGF